jgi:hypothetical protein
MGDDDGQGIFVLRFDMDEMDVEAVDLGDELRERNSSVPLPCASHSSANALRAS